MTRMCVRDLLVIKTSLFNRLEEEKKMTNLAREELRTEYSKNKIDCFSNIILRRTLITITTNKTNASLSDFKNDIRTINAKLNRKIFGRKFYKSRNRIVFHTFYELSNKKRLRHCHVFLRVPTSLNPLLSRTIFKSNESSENIKNKILYEYLPEIVKQQNCDKIDIRENRPAIRYSSKHYNLVHNSNFEKY